VEHAAHNAVADGLHREALAAWERTSRTLHLSPAERQAHLLSGLELTARALAIDSHDATALLIRALLLRTQAALTDSSPDDSASLRDEADRLVASAIAAGFQPKTFED
jgi:hypothetical protein